MCFLSIILGILGIVGTLAGTFLGYHLTARRDVAKEKKEFKKIKQSLSSELIFNDQRADMIKEYEYVNLSNNAWRMAQTSDVLIEENVKLQLDGIYQLVDTINYRLPTITTASATDSRRLFSYVDDLKRKISAVLVDLQHMEYQG